MREQAFALASRVVRAADNTDANLRHEHLRVHAKRNREHLSRTVGAQNIGILRRRGDAVITLARDFLEKGRRYRAEIYRDGDDADYRTTPRSMVVEQRTVTIGQLDNQMRVIESGLKAEDWVVTDGIQRAIPGGKVEPDKQKMVAAAGG